MTGLDGTQLTIKQQVVYLLMHIQSAPAADRQPLLQYFEGISAYAGSVEDLIDEQQMIGSKKEFIPVTIIAKELPPEGEV
jgi:hypothetical protein